MSDSRRFRMAAMMLLAAICGSASAQREAAAVQQDPAEAISAGAPMPTAAAEPLDKRRGAPATDETGVEIAAEAVSPPLDEILARREGATVLGSGAEEVVGIAADEGEVVPLPADVVFREVVVPAGAGRVRVERVADEAGGERLIVRDAATGRTLWVEGGQALDSSVEEAAGGDCTGCKPVPHTMAIPLRQDAQPAPGGDCTGCKPVPHTMAIPFGQAGEAGGAGGGDSGLSESGDAAGEFETRLVYSNVLGQKVFGPEGNTALSRIADDITTTALAGCPLDRYALRFFGNRLFEPPDRGPFSVTVALYKACPNAGGAMIEGTDVTIDFPNDGEYVVLIQVPSDVQIPLPQSFYVGVQFNRPYCGVVVGAPASVGFSADRFDFPGTACSAGLGGFPSSAHASFYAEFYIREPCGEAFPAYKASNHAGSAYSVGGGVYFAQQVRLAVPTCRIKAWEIAYKGNTIIQADLRTELSNEDASNGGLISGTRAMWLTTGTPTRIYRHELPEPANLPSSELFVVFRTGGTTGGPIRTCRKSYLGSTGNELFAYSSGRWNAVAGAQDCWNALDIALYCEDPPPVGACCDMILRDLQGESVCRDLPEMNCPFPELWVKGGRCGPVCAGGENEGQSCALDEDCPDGACVGSFCAGGDNDGAPCTRAADCPNGSCEGGPFAHACGLSACCKPDNTCENLTRNECSNVEPLEATRIYQRGRFCEDPDLRCPYLICLDRTGGCSYSRYVPGCDDASCCLAVCDEDPFCCLIAWDAECVRRTISLCDTWSATDDCHSFRPNDGAIEVPANGSIAMTNFNATTDPGDPGFSCHPAGAGQQGFATSWLSFVAAHTSAQIQTCRGEEAGVDAIIGVYRATDHSSEEAACASLEEIACNSGSVGCGRGFAARVCAENLTIGEKYYIQLAARTDDAWGVHEVDVLSPCPQTPTPCPPAEVVVIDPPSGAVDARGPVRDEQNFYYGIGVDIPPAAADPACWMPCDTKPRYSLNIEEGLYGGPDGTYVVPLHYNYTPPLGHLIGVEYFDREGTLTSHYFRLHPADVNGDGVSSPADILYLIDVLNGVREAPWGKYSVDCDGSGAAMAADILCVIDTLNRTDPAWLNFRFEDEPSECIQECPYADSRYCSTRAFCKIPMGWCTYEDADDLGVAICHWKPVSCPGDIDPVCGCDGNTYANECFADAAGVSVRHLRACGP